VSTPTIAQIYQHRSIRAYKPDPVATALIEEIIAAGQRASTSSNLQMFSAVVVTDAQKRNQLATYCGDQAHIRQAPVFIAWCADLNRLSRVCALRNHTHAYEYLENFLVSAVDVAILMQTATLAAESLGLGMCYIGAIRNQPQDVIRLLKLPRLVMPISGMTLGWPADDPIIKPRLAKEAIIHWETYDSSGEEPLLQEYDRVMAETGIYEGRHVPVPGAPEQMEAYGWLEHSARRVSQPRREGLRHVVEQQEFLLQ
jgi:FMN reductase (NADPH)